MTRPEDEMTRDESAAERALAPLRALGPPGAETSAGARHRSRLEERLAGALAQEMDARTRARQPLWRRRVAVPLPAAAAFLLAFVALATLAVGNHLGQPEIAEPGVVANPDRVIAEARPAPVNGAPSNERELEPSTSSADCQIQYYEEGIVVAGLGTIKSTQLYRCESE